MKLLTRDKTLIIDASDGREVFVNNQILSQNDGILKDHVSDDPGIICKEQIVDIYELVEDATLKQMINCLGVSFDKLCMANFFQITKFCEKYPRWLKKEHCITLFFYKSDGKIKIADVKPISNNFYTPLKMLENGGVWDAKFPLRIVIPR